MSGCGSLAMSRSTVPLSPPRSQQRDRQALAVTGIAQDHPQLLAQALIAHPPIDDLGGNGAGWRKDKAGLGSTQQLGQEAEEVPPRHRAVIADIVDRPRLT